MASEILSFNRYHPMWLFWEINVTTCDFRNPILIEPTICGFRKFNPQRGHHMLPWECNPHRGHYLGFHRSSFVAFATDDIRNLIL